MKKRKQVSARPSVSDDSVQGGELADVTGRRSSMKSLSSYASDDVR